MQEEIKVPAMGESITEAEVGNFLKPSGSAVQEEEEIIELETEKVNQVLYAPIAGTITWHVSEGDTVKIGDLLGVVDSEGAAADKKEKAEVEEKPSEPEPVKEKPSEPEPVKEKPSEPEPVKEKPSEPEPVKEKPSEPEPVKEKPSEPEPVKEEPVLQPVGEGRGKRAMHDAFVSGLREKSKEVAPQPKESLEPVAHERESRKKMSKIRKTIAGRLVDSLHQSAMLTTFNEVDMSAVMMMRSKYKESFIEKHGVKLGFMSFFVKAVVEALKTYPGFNSYIDGEEIVERHYYDIGIAVGTEKGLFVPVVRECDTLSFAQIEKQIVEYAKKAREGKLAIKDLQGGGFTITNGGVYGSLLSTPILNPPQVGILGMHKIMERPIAVDGKIELRPMMYLALSYDHRIVDGKEAVTFLIRVKEILEDPSRLMLIESDG